MAILVGVAQVRRVAPNARSVYLKAIEQGQVVLDRHEISANALRVRHFLGQTLHETGGYTILVENLNYSAQRLPVVWPSRFKPRGPLEPATYAHQPEKLANEVYGARMGNNQPGDGFRFRGRGMLQLTGRESYERTTTELRQADPTAPNFATDPDAVLSESWCLAVAAAEWAEKGCNALADADDIRKITRRINGGYIGLSSRIEWVRRAKAEWP